jgi:hypothetical protein
MAAARQHVARRVWPVATHQGELIHLAERRHVKLGQPTYFARDPLGHGLRCGVPVVGVAPHGLADVEELACAPVLEVSCCLGEQPRAASAMVHLISGGEPDGRSKCP